MKNCNSNNYWYGNGTYQKLDEELEKLLPNEGSVKNPKKNKCLENYLKAKYAWDGETLLDPEAVANPCGLIANSFFTDSFAIVNKDTGDKIKIHENGLVWPDDLE